VTHPHPTSGPGEAGTAPKHRHQMALSCPSTRLVLNGLVAYHRNAKSSGDGALAHAIHHLHTLLLEHYRLTHDTTNNRN
jgi:hypothetical protein